MVTVIMPVFNDDTYIGAALDAILRQSYVDFELMIVDDHSTDGTPELLKSVTDPRVKMFRNSRNAGISRSRNVGLKHARGEYMFFTDSDCVVDKDWLKNGLTAFEDDVLGVEGLTFYVSEDYKPSIADRLPGRVATPSEFMTCNIAYRKSVFDTYGYFDEKYNRHGDRELGLRVSRHGRIAFCTEMRVTHQRKSWNFRSMVQSGQAARDKVLLFKYYDERISSAGRILYPKNFLKTLFPPILVFTFFNNEIRSWNDFVVFLAVYPALVFERYVIWKTAIREKLFVL